MSSEKFETLDEDVQVLLEILGKKLENHLGKCHGEERKALIADIERGIDEAKQAVFEMEAELRIAPGSYRVGMMPRIRKHQDTIRKFSLKLTYQPKFEDESSRKALMENPSSRNSQLDYALQKTVRQGTESLERTSQSLFRTTQIALETEEIGTGVIQELSQQREVLDRTRERLTDTDVELGRSRRILQMMYRGSIANKFILVLIIFLEVGILAGLIYYKFFS